VSLGFVLAVLSGTVAAAFVSGLSGFAFGMVALSVWAWALEPRLLSPLIVFGSLIAQIVALGTLRMRLEWAKLLPFLIPGMLGVPLGVRLLAAIDLTWFRICTGVLLIVFGGGMLLARDLPPLRYGGRVADGVMGLIAGVMGGLAGLSGPVPILWCTVRRWDKDVQRSVFQIFNVVMQALALTSYAASGIITVEIGWVFALMLPAILLPTWLGARLYHRISEVAFRRVVLALLLISGCVLVATSV
jgi:uncharacterized membrane protein YfcA